MAKPPGPPLLSSLASDRRVRLAPASGRIRLAERVTVSGTYGTGYPLPVLAAAMSKVEYPGLDLKHFN